MSDTSNLITRRQALARVAYLMGGSLSASTVAGVLAGCGSSLEAAEAATRQPQTLSPRQREMVLIMGEHLIPATDTPGARAARVDEYIDAMLTEFYSEKLRQRFLAGLERVEARARQVFGKRFLEIGPEQQLAMSRALNREAFRERREQAPSAQEDRRANEGVVSRGDDRALPTLDDGWEPEDVGRGSFFRTFKELVLVGYYTSEVGATMELRPNPMGVWRSDVPYVDIGQAWA